MAASISEVLEALVEALAIAVATTVATSILVLSGGSVHSSESLVGSVGIVGVFASILGESVVTSSLTEAAVVASLTESKASLATVSLVATIGLFATVVLVSSEINASVIDGTEAEMASLVSAEADKAVAVAFALELSGLTGHSED